LTIRLIDCGVSVFSSTASQRLIARKIGPFLISAHSSHSRSPSTGGRPKAPCPPRRRHPSWLAKLNCEPWQARRFRIARIEPRLIQQLLDAWPRTSARRHAPERTPKGGLRGPGHRLNDPSRKSRSTNPRHRG
jgi:hypothetical protein